MLTFYPFNFDLFHNDKAKCSIGPTTGSKQYLHYNQTSGLLPLKPKHITHRVMRQKTQNKNRNKQKNKHFFLLLSPGRIKSAISTIWTPQRTFHRPSVFPGTSIYVHTTGAFTHTCKYFTFLCSLFF